MSRAAVELFRLKRIEFQFRMTGSIAIALECSQRLRLHADRLIQAGCK